MPGGMEYWKIALLVACLLGALPVLWGFWALHLRTSLTAYESRGRQLTRRLMLLERELFYYAKLDEELDAESQGSAEGVSHVR